MTLYTSTEAAMRRAIRRELAENRRGMTGDGPTRPLLQRMRSTASPGRTRPLHPGVSPHMEA